MKKHQKNKREVKEVKYTVIEADVWFQSSSL